MANVAVLNTGSSAKTPSIIDEYVSTFPTRQNAVDIFKGEWSSAFPDDSNCNSAGSADLFDDARIKWIGQHTELKGLSTLELGPLEAAHTYTLLKMGVKYVDAIEANTRAFLKCLIVKELFGLNEASFYLGDINEYMRNTDKSYDLCVASGVLYHQKDPVETLELISKVSDKAFIWTHFYDEAGIEDTSTKYQFSSSITKRDYNGMEISYYPRDYLKSLNWGGFCGGGNTMANWMNREDILEVIEHLGYKKIEIMEPAMSPNGPSFCLYIEK